MFENYTERGTRHSSMTNGLGTAMHAKCQVATRIVWTCDLGYQHLGPHYCAYSSHNSIGGCIALGLAMSHPAPFLHISGEDYS